MHLYDSQDEVLEDRLREVRELALQLNIANLDNASNVGETLDAVSNSLLKIKSLCENGTRLLRLILLLYDLSKFVSDSYACMYVKRTILPVLYFSETLVIDDIQYLREVESQYVPPHLLLLKENTNIFDGKEEKNNDNSVNESTNDGDSDSNEDGDGETGLPPMIQPYKELESLYKTLRGIRQHLIYFETRAILSNPAEDAILLGRISRIVMFLVLESAHRKNLLPNLQSSFEPPEFDEFVNQALLIVGRHLAPLYSHESVSSEKAITKEMGKENDNSKSHDLELDNMNSHGEEMTNIELSILQLRRGYELILVLIPIALFKADDGNQNRIEFFQKWTPPSSLSKVWAKQISATIEGLDDTSDTLLYAIQKINEYEKTKKFARWADVSRIKTRLVVLPLLSKRLNSQSFLVADLTELKKAYFVNGLIEGIWTSFWTIVLLFTLVIVFLQILSAESILSLITVWNSKDKYAITAILYESANSNTVMITVYCISALPLMWGFYKGVKSMLSITNDPKDEFRDILLRLKKEVEGLGVSGWFLRVIWWDRLRWKLPWYKLRNQLEGLMELIRWDARISAADRYDALSILILVYQNRGGETRSLVSGYIAEFVDITRPNAQKFEPVVHGDNDSSLLAVNLQISDEETLITRATKTKAIEFLLSIGEFPSNEWRHAKWYSYPSLIWNYLEGRYLNWWIGLSPTVYEFALFFILSIVLIAMSLLFVSTAVEAIREYAACPKMKGIAFTGPAPYVGKFDADCWEATMNEFGRIPGQPPETLISTLPKFYFSKETRKSFTLDISGKYLDGDQIGKLIDGFRENGFTITRLIAKQSSMGTLTGMKPGFLTTFSNSLEKLSSSLEVLDLSECSLGEGLISILMDLSEWRRFYQVLGGLKTLKSLNLANNLLGVSLIFSSESGEKLSDLFINSMLMLTGLQELDLSDNVFAYCDIGDRPDVCLDLGRAIASMQSLKRFTFQNNFFLYANVGLKGMIDSINNPDLAFVDFSRNPTESTDFKRSILSLISRHRKLEHLDLGETWFFKLLDKTHDNFAQMFSKSIGTLAGSLKFLNLSRTSIGGTYSTEDSFASVLDAMSTLEKLETLDLFGNSIGDFSQSERVSSALGNMLSHLNSLRALSVHENYLGFDLWNVVSEHTKLHPKLEITPYLVSMDDIKVFVRASLQDGRLSLRNRLISGFADDAETGVEIFRVYRDIFNTIAEQDANLVSMDISGVGLEQYSAVELYLVGEGLENIALKGKKSLQELSLADNFIAKSSNPDALASLKKGIIAHKHSLKHLDLRGRGMTITMEFAEMLSDTLIELGQLESLDISRNNFREEQIIYKYIGKGIRHLRSLRKLVLGHNFGLAINYEGAKYLIDSISELSNLKELYMGSLDLGSHSTVLPSFAKIFAMPSLRALHLNNNVIFYGLKVSNEAVAFLESMKQAKDLRVLDLTGNNLGLTPLMESKTIDTIKSLENLCTLYLSNNLFGVDPRSKGLGELISVLPRLISFDLRGVAGVDWTEHASSISETIARDLRTKCESRVCRGSKVAAEPPICPI